MALGIVSGVLRNPSFFNECPIASLTFLNIYLFCLVADCTISIPINGLLKKVLVASLKNLAVCC